VGKNRALVPIVLLILPTSPTRMRERKGTLTSPCGRNAGKGLEEEGTKGEERQIDLIPCGAGSRLRGKEKYQKEKRRDREST